MNSAPSAVTDENSPDPGPDSVSVRAGACWFACLALFALPVAKWWHLTGDVDGVIAFSALVASFGWWLSRALQQAAPRTSPLAALAGIALLAAQLWMLLWLRVEDFWVARWGFFVIAVAGSLLLWGWPGPLRGLRALLALGLWAVLPPGSFSIFENVTWLTKSTAAFAGFILARIYPEAVIEGATIHLPHGSVAVLPACTAMPLWISLLHLFVPAWLVFKLRWRQAIVVMLVTAVAAYFLSCVRVLTMAVYVADKARFDYWHGPDGASWFTAAGMIVMAGCIDRFIPHETVTEEKRVTFVRGQALTLRVFSTLSVLAAVAATWTGKDTPPAVPSRIPALPGFSVAEAKSETAIHSEKAKQGAFLWQRHVIYRSGLTGARIEVRLSYAPNLLEGDPVAGDKQWLLLASGSDWRDSAWTELAVTGLGSLRERTAPDRRAWVATLPVGATPIANRSQWEALRKERTRQVSTWVRWLAGRAPMRDKRAYWLEVVWTGPGQPTQETMQTAFSEWYSVATASNLPASR